VYLEVKIPSAFAVVGMSKIDKKRFDGKDIVYLKKHLKF
jgi:hypothetical protein